jgi:hypothetical protein
MLAEAKYHSHQYWNGQTYQVRSVWSDGSGAWMPKTFFEIWDQYGTKRLHDRLFRSVGAANKKAHELIAEGKIS